MFSACQVYTPLASPPPAATRTYLLLLVACRCLRVHGDVAELLGAARILLPRTFLFSSSSFDVVLLPPSAGFFPILFSDAHEPLVLCLRSLLAVVVLHPRAEVVLGAVQVLLHAAWESHLDVAVAVRGIQPLGQGVPRLEHHPPGGGLVRL